MRPLGRQHDKHAYSTAKLGRARDRNTQRRAERTECPVHSFQHHGKEAEELRAGVEKIIQDYGIPENRTHDGALLRAMQQLLDSVDARDSLAYLERSTPKRGNGDPP